jgi:hypothetical protein
MAQSTIVNSPQRCTIPGVKGSKKEIEFSRRQSGYL